MKAVKRFIIPVLLVAATVAAIAATPRLRSLFLTAPSPAPDKTNTATAYSAYSEDEEALFTELAGLYNRLGTMTAFFAEGSIRVTDQADTSKSMFTRFRYYRRDSMSYYQLGDQEILTVPGLSLTINHEVKKIFMAPRDSGVQAAPMIINENQLKALKEERYNITKEYSEPLTVIRLRNEKHITCREYRVAYDSTGFIRRVFMRNADEQMPTDLSRDKLISVSINTWQTGQLPEQLLDIHRYIQKGEESWLPAPAYRNYEIKYIY